jgi:HPt (histidine-containing phosphotransfer) domain-containing protein
MTPATPDQSPIQSQFADDTEMVELIEYFVAELGARSEQIAGLLAARKLDELRVVAHQLKGAAGGYGYPALSEAAAVLEQHLATPDRNLDSVQNAVSELQGICDRAIRGHPHGA